MGSRFVVSQPELSLWTLIFKSKQNLSNLSAFSDFTTQSKAKQHLPTWLTFLNPSESRCRPKNRSDYVSLYILYLSVFCFHTRNKFKHGRIIIDLRIDTYIDLSPRIFEKNSCQDNFTFIANVHSRVIVNVNLCSNIFLAIFKQFRMEDLFLLFLKMIQNQ